MAKNFKNKIEVILLVLILFLAAFLRFYELNTLPPSLFIDEVDSGYQAYSIFKTGRDYFGNFMPIHFQSLADWRSPLYLYSTVLTVALFGLNEWGVRLPIAISGFFCVWLIFLITKKIFKNQKLAILAAFIMAVNPWSLHYSRGWFEATMMLALFLAAFYTFLLGLKKRKFLVFSALFFGLTPYAYSIAKFFVPFFLFLLILIYKGKLKCFKRKELATPFLILILLWLPMVNEIIFGQGNTRFNILSIFTDSNSIGPALHARFLSTMAVSDRLLLGIHPVSLAVIFHNQLTIWFKIFAVNYLTSFSPQFLFINGDPNWRHSIPNIGMFYWLESCSILIGGYWLLAKLKNNKLKRLFFSWLLLAPIPAAITRDGAGHATRLLFLLPILLIFSALGFWQIMSFLKKTVKRKVIMLALFLLFFFNFCWYLFDYRFIYPIEACSWWDYGYKEMIAVVDENEDKFDSIIFTILEKEILQFILFYEKIDPAFFQRNGLPDKYRLAEFDPGLILKEKFMADQSCQDLYVGKKEEVKNLIRKKKLPDHLSLIQLINYPTGDIAFYLIRKIDCQ